MRLGLRGDKVCCFHGFNGQATRPKTAERRTIRKRILQIGQDLNLALASDVSMARQILSDKLGDIVVEERLRACA